MQETLMQPTELFSIGELSSKTGINSVTLRAWERRYGLLKPQRTDKGHRLYSEKDSERVQQILWLIERGVPLRKIKPLLTGEESLATVELDEEGQHWRQQLMSALGAVNTAALARTLQQLFKQYPASWCRTQVIEPLFAGLSGQSQSAALEALLQAELMRYVARYPMHRKAKQGDTLLVLGAGQTAAWRPALLALQLAEQQPCQWMPGTFSLTALQQLLHLQPDLAVLYCLDGVLNAADSTALHGLLEKYPQLGVQGTAARLAFAGHKQLKETL